MNISIIGAGYVGIVAGACLAKFRHQVCLIDVNEQRVTDINNNNSPIYEEGLDDLLNEVELVASMNYDTLEKAEVIFVCVGTPTQSGAGVSTDQLVAASNQIKMALSRRRDYCLVVIKSTVPPGTTEEVVIPLLEESGKKAGEDFGVCMSPEFLREGKAIYDFTNPARLVIGEYDKRSGSVLGELYQSFDVPIMRVDIRSAEMIKLASNTFLATKISFINEIGNICKQLGIDTYEVAKGMGLDERIGNSFLNAGIGFGGSCLPKDLTMLMATSLSKGYEPKMLEQVFRLNNEQPTRMISLLKKHVTIKGSSIGILGLAFKPNTDDVRDSPATKIVKILTNEGAKVTAYDPIAGPNFRKLFPQIEYASAERVLLSDAILIATEWEEFNHLDYTGKIIIDGRNIAKAREARVYEGVNWR